MGFVISQSQSAEYADIFQMSLQAELRQCDLQSTVVSAGILAVEINQLGVDRIWYSDIVVIQ